MRGQHGILNAPRRWIDLIDLVSLILLVLAVFVGAFGGFRVRVGDVRLSLTSGLRLALLGVGFVGVRHLVARDRPLHTRVAAAFVNAWRSEAVRAARPVFISSRVAVLAAGYLAVVIIGYPQPPPFRVSANELQNLPARWDSGWYLGIASEGYRWNPRTNQQQNIAFFPAFPLAMRAGSLLLGVRAAEVVDPTKIDEYIEQYHVTFLFVGLAIALAAFFGGLVYLHRLAREDLGLDRETAATALVLMAAYPFALYYSAVYTESLFLLAVVGAIYHFRRDHFVAAAAWGLVAGLTRPNGFLLSLPLATFLAERRLGWLSRLTGRPPGGEAKPTASQSWVDVARLIVAGAPVAGIVAYSAFVYRLSGRPFAWAEVHEAAWGRAFQGIEGLLTDRFRYIAEYGLYQYTASLPIDALNGLAVVLALVAIWPVTRRFGAAYGVFIAANLFPPLFAGGLLSMGRLTSVVFPTFLWLALAVPATHRSAWTCGFATLQGLAAALFFTWRPLY